MQRDPRELAEDVDRDDPRAPTVLPEPPSSAAAAPRGLIADPHECTEEIDRCDPHDLVDRSELLE